MLEEAWSQANCGGLGMGIPSIPGAGRASLEASIPRGRGNAREKMGLAPVAGEGRAMKNKYTGSLDNGLG